MLKKENFLEEVLTKIGGQRPCIRFKKPPSSTQELSFFQNKIPAHTWKQILGEVASRFEGKQLLAFKEALVDPSISSPVPEMLGATQSGFEGLKIAIKNLSESNAYFETRFKDSSLESLVPKLLYYKTTVIGTGKELKNCDRVRIGYLIEDLNGNTLFANHDTWLSLSQTIPGFAHGIQGMHIGEERDIFIHPALAYGALTTLPPCAGLIAHVHLRDMEEKGLRPLPPLIPMDLNWVESPALYRMIEESIQRQPGFIGTSFRILLDKIEGSETVKVNMAGF